MAWRFSSALIDKIGKGDGDCTTDPRYVKFANKSKSTITTCKIEPDDGGDLVATFIADLRETGLREMSIRETGSRENNLARTIPIMVFNKITRCLEFAQRSLFDFGDGGFESCPRFGRMFNGLVYNWLAVEHDPTVTDWSFEDRLGTPLASVVSSMSESWTHGLYNPQLKCKKEGGRVKMAWVEHLMGWPVGWTNLNCFDPEEFCKFERIHRGDARDDVGSISIFEEMS
jgi:hypothetical protein